MTLADLKLSVRASNCLESENIMTVRDLVTRTEDQLLEVRNFGETTLDEVQQKLRDLGLQLGMRVPAPRPASKCQDQLIPSRRESIDCRLNRQSLEVTRDAMRHRRTGRMLGRNPSHQRALLRSLASALFLTERDAEFDESRRR